MRMIPRYTGLVLTLLLSGILCVGIGAVELPLSLFLTCLLQECQQSLSWQIMLELRLPRLLLGMLAGAGLALSGALLQNLTRNPLADPYLFGLIAGAGLGATVASLFVTATSLLLPLAAFLGALTSMALVFLFTLTARRQQLETFILSGVAVSFLLSSVTALLLYQADAFAANRIMFWLMGSLARAEMQAVWLIFPVLMLTFTVSLFYRRHLDAMQCSDQTATSLGVAVKPLRMALLILSAALTALIVAYCGGIGFVGLMIPHAARILFGAQTHHLVLASCGCGAIFMIWVDAGARSLLDNQEIPLGVITAACGSIFFLIILSRRAYGSAPQG